MPNRGLPDVEKLMGKYLGRSAALPSLPAMESQKIQGGMGNMGQASLGAGYQKAKRFGVEPDFKKFLMKYAGVDDKNESTIAPRELLNL